MEKIFICTDLDRTLLPNGLQPESLQARPLFNKLAAEPFVTLAYVSGRDLGLLKEAIREYELPVPDFAVGDVGTTIYTPAENDWQEMTVWQEIIGKDWQGSSHAELAALLAGITELEIQEPEKQGPFKLSYYTDPGIDPDSLAEKVRQSLAKCPARVSLIHSVDETRGTGLFDVLPAGATKLHAIRFLAGCIDAPHERTIYAGDSGNDLPIIASDIKATLVANATPDVQARARALSPTDSLHIAEGGFLGLNGNYSGGVLEGLAHYLPETRPLLEDLLQNLEND